MGLDGGKVGHGGHLRGGGGLGGGLGGGGGVLLSLEGGGRGEDEQGHDGGEDKEELHLKLAIVLAILLESNIVEES